MKTKRKNIFKSLLALTLALIMVLGVAPLNELAGVDFASLFAPKAEAVGKTYKVGDIVEFGSYPQSRVTDSSLVSALNGVSKNWVSYGYYSGEGYGDSMIQGNWMKYADFAYNGTKYRAVTFSQYRPSFTCTLSSSSYTDQDDNGYTPNNIYYFKYEPLKWRVLDPSTGLVLCESIIDSQAYSNTVYGYGTDPYYPGPTPAYWNDAEHTHYANDYVTSSIRAWLNDDFYNTAFSSSQKANISTSELDNKAYSTSRSRFDSETTYDKVFLLSWSDMQNTAYGFPANTSSSPARQARGTDYAKCQGLAVDLSSKCSTQRLRSAGNNSGEACRVDSDGDLWSGWNVDSTDDGVRPAIKISNLASAISEPGSNPETLLDTDGDGLPDVWEKEGLDYDGDGKIDVDLPAMGADPNVPDIFVEVDWMVRPQKKFLWWEISKYRNLAPSEDAMKLVYDSFKQHEINLHIDVGPDSIDFVTGKKWGKLSGGNEIPYKKKFNIKSSWNSTVNANFSKARHNVFKHCLFVDQYDGVRSGIANNIPGQFFIVANQDWVFNGGNISVGGTFMHELGHTLGLRHGGCDNEHYKPNYLSVMNYTFQTTGLVGSGMVGYSDYKLPDINEAHINEKLGIDPSGLTVGTGLGTTLFYWASNQRNVIPISKAAIDFNNNGNLETDISLDLNPDGNVYDKPIAVLKGHEDWSGIVYKSGAIGEHNNSSNGNSSGIAFQINDTGLQEKTLEEALKTSTLASSGTGYVELLPSSLITDLNGQSLEFEVGNMSANETTFTVNIQCKSLFDNYTKSITIPGSRDKIESERIVVPITKNILSDEYTITCSIVSDGKSSDYTFSQEAVQVDKEDIEEMKKLLSGKNELTDEEVSKIESAIEKYENAESNNICKLCGKNHGTSFFGKLKAFFHKIAYSIKRFFTRLFSRFR
ncbi:MAG: DUF6273 domain-containing protein [Oscillospiraceae bacterium]|nr:DUF6273 domain-containing protein [Oscillospiraceae bacterium]